MQAIILAAGMGRRLGELTRYDTKCMIEVNGIQIIDRLLANLAVARLSRIVLVIGFQGDKLRAYLGNEYCGIPIYYLENPYYAYTNNIYSLFLARHHLASDDTLLLESDIVFEKRILERVLEEPYPDVAVVDRYKSWMDGTMVTVDEKQFIVDFVSKHTFSYEKTSTYFKTVNIYRFSKEFSVGKYVPFLEAYCKCFDNSAYYEQILAVLSLLDKAGLKALPLEGEKWYEIDDMQDLDIAETLFGKKEGLLPGYQKRYGGYWRFPFLLDFAYLVNPHFPTERMLEELKANFDKLLRQYPSGSYVNRRLVAKHWSIPAEAVAVGNGAAELIRKLMELLPGRMGVILPTFEEYLVRDDRIETFLPLGPGYRYTVSDLKTFFEDKGVTSLLLLNPDNPSGNSIPYEDLISLAGWTQERSIRLIVDESFIDFSEGGEETSLIDDKILKEYNHLVVIKSLSKSHGIPGLRLGIAVSGDHKLMDELQQKLPVWNINSLAEYYLQILDKYTIAYRQACARFREERALFFEELQEVGYLAVFPSQANFFLCEVTHKYSARELAEVLLREHDILVKDCSLKRGMYGKQYIRIAIRSKEENRYLTGILKYKL